MIEVQPELLVRWSGGAVNLLGDNTTAYGTYTVETLADGTDWGNIESVRRTLRSAIRDGSRTTKDRDENRRIALKLRVSAPFHSALAAGEQELDRIDGRRCELVWTPPGTLGVAPSVFVVDYADLTHEMDDLGYERGELYYQLALSSLPHVYADSWITVPALVQAPSIPVTVALGSSTTGWTATGGTLSTSGDKLVVTPEAGSVLMTATRTGAVDLTTDRYLTVWGNRPDSVEVLNGATWTELTLVGMDGNYHVYSALALADPTIDAFRFKWELATSGVAGPFGPRSFVEVRKQAAPRSTAARQQSRAVAVPGSRRTPASVLIQSPTTGLGVTLAYGGPQYNPALSRGAQQSRATTSTTLSGSQGQLNTGGYVSFIVPATEFYAGSHSLYVVARSVAGEADTTGTLTATVKLLNSSNVAVTETTRTRKLVYPVDEKKVTLMGAVDLPGAALPPDSSAVVYVQLNWLKDASHGTDERDLWIDEVLVFNRTLGRLVIANAGGNRKVWLDGASIDVDHDVVFAGSGPKSDAVPLSMHDQLPAWMGALTMTPGTTYLYVGTTGAPDTTVEAAFRPAGNTHMPNLVV